MFHCKSGGMLPDPPFSSFCPSLHCPWCSFVAQDARESRTHLRTCVKKPPPPLVTCKNCGKCFTSKGLHTHLRSCLEKKIPISKPAQSFDSEYKSRCTEEGQINNHSARSTTGFRHHGKSNTPLNGVEVDRNPKLLLPKGNDKTRWKKLDLDLETYVEYNLPKSMRRSCPIDELAEQQSKLIYSFLFDECGPVPPPSMRTDRSAKRPPHRHQKLRKQKNKLLKQVKLLKKSGKITEMRKARSDLSRISRELVRINKHAQIAAQTYDRIRSQLSFNDDRFKFAKRVFQNVNSCRPSVDKTETENHFKDTYSDGERSSNYTPPPGLQRKPPPQEAFNGKNPTRLELQSFLIRKSNGSSPGPDGLSYLVYKKLPFAFNLLFDLISRAFKERTIPRNWGWAFIVLLSKGENAASHAKDLRPIACTNTAGKLFWSIMNDRLRSFWQQKGALSDVSGCLEHTWNLIEALKDAKANKRQIIISWLDLKNAYGSIRHNLIQFALEWYHVPEWFADLVFQYYDSLFAFVTTPEWSTNLFPFLQGVFQGCVISGLLFIGVFQLLIDHINQFGLDPYTWNTQSGKDLSLLQQAYVDDHTLINASPRGAQHNLTKLQRILDWTRRLVLKVSKCYSLGIADKRWKTGTNKGKSHGPFNPELSLNDEPLRFIGDSDTGYFKFLGRKIWPIVSDKPALTLTFESFEKDLILVDKLNLSGASKAWIYQHYALSRLAWPFLVYSFSVEGIKPFAQLASRLLKKWYGMNKAANPALLFLPKSVGGWNLTSPVDMFKSMQVVGQHILAHSQDPLTRATSLSSRSKAHDSTSNRWEPGVALDDYQSRLAFQMRFGGQTGTQGLGFKPSLKNQSLKEKRKAISNLCKKDETNSRLLLLYDLARSGDFLKWDDMMSNQHDWNSQILHMSPAELAFALNAQALTETSPSNLRRWGLNHTASCPLCHKFSADGGHILSGCPVSLFQDRYTWRHDNILRCILPDLNGLVARANRQPPAPASTSLYQTWRCLPQKSPQ